MSDLLVKLLKDELSEDQGPTFYDGEGLCRACELQNDEEWNSWNRGW
jgi:hypothetical protein